MESVTVLAPAKLNLFLHITGRRENGYHNLETLFVMIDLADTLSLTLNDQGEIKRTGDLVGDASNDLCVKAAKAIKNYSKTTLGVTIDVKKRIPSGAGMGGGSSDAASTLLALNKLWRLNYSQATLLKIALTLGADVPFFVFGRTAFARGVGEKLQSVDLPDAFVAISKPSTCVSTQEIYSDPLLKRDCKPLISKDFIQKQCHVWPSLLGVNVMQEIVENKIPAVRRTRELLGAGARMTGSGSSVFKLCLTKEEARLCLKATPKENFNWFGRVLPCHPLSKDGSLG